MTKVDKLFDNFWKAESLKLAAQEQLSTSENLDIKSLFKRARFIYIEGYRQEIQNWEELVKHLVEVDKLVEEPIKEQEEPIKETKPASELKKEEVTVHTEAINEREKKCPSCGEIIPIKWPQHLYKKNGEKCGHKF